eukprot:gene20048-24038_t
MSYKDVMDLCKQKSITMSGGRSKAMLVKKLLDQQQGGATTNVDMTDSQDDEDVEDQVVLLTLPDLLIHRIIGTAWKLETSGVLSLGDNLSRSTQEIYLDRWRWCLTLATLSKSVFAFVSQSLFREVKHHCEYDATAQQRLDLMAEFVDHLANPLCPLSYVDTLTINTECFLAPVLQSSPIIQSITSLTLSDECPVEVILAMPMLRSLTFQFISNGGPGVVVNFDFSRLAALNLTSFAVKCLNDEPGTTNNIKTLLEYIQHQTTLTTLHVYLFTDQAVITSFHQTLETILATKPLITNLTIHSLIDIPSTVTSLTIRDWTQPTNEPRLSAMLAKNKNLLELSLDSQSAYKMQNFNFALLAGSPSLTTVHLFVNTYHLQLQYLAAKLNQLLQSPSINTIIVHTIQDLKKFQRGVPSTLTISKFYGNIDDRGQLTIHLVRKVSR